MDTNIRMEFNRVWGELSRIDKELNLCKFKVELNNTAVNEVKKDLEDHLEKRWNNLNAGKDRKTNVKIAIIGAIAIAIPSLIAILAR